MSPLLARLRHELTVATDPLLRAELLARIGCYLARVGEFDEARACVEALRQEYGDGRSGRTTVWIMLTESLILLYGELSPLAMDRAIRAQALGLAMRYRPAVALVSAWKAHLEFELSAFDAMVRSLRLAFDQVLDDDADALTRLAIVLSNSFMICGDRASAQDWFLRGHDLASKNGDQASIEALLYNRTAFGVAHLRAHHCLSEEASVDLGLVRREVDSSRNLQKLTKISALTNHIHLWSARLSIIEGNFEVAMNGLIAAKATGPFAEYNFSDKMIDLEISYCLARMGRFDEAVYTYSTVRFESFERLDLDEQLMIAWIRHRLAVEDGRFGVINERKSYLNEIQQAFTESRQGLALQLNAWAKH